MKTGKRNVSLVGRNATCVEFMGLAASRLGELTRREREVARMTQARATNQEIARRLRIKESTVKFHLSNIYSKLGITGWKDLAD